MTFLASRSQVRASFLRWALVLIPAILLAGFLSGQMAGSGPGNPWFDDLTKPAIFPPPALFGIVWSILYIMMGVSLALVIAARGARGRVPAIGAFLLQLAFNLAWTPVFFAAHHITAALVVIAILDALVIITIVLFWRVRGLAGALLLPYLAWVLFATLLTWQFLQANPDADGRTANVPVARMKL